MEPKIIIGLCGIVAVIVIAVIHFMNQSKEEKIKNVKEWLKYAVSIAEKEFGSGTGQLKLREVYDMAVKQFPWLVTLVTFEVFSGWVDEALVWMKEQIEQNKYIKMYIKE